MSSPGLPRSGSRCQRRARPHIGDVAPPPESPARPSPPERPNRVADKVADTTPPQPATKEENIRAKSEAGDPSTPTMLLRARTTVSLAASQAMGPEESVGIKSGRTRGGGLGHAHDSRRARSVLSAAAHP